MPSQCRDGLIYANVGSTRWRPDERRPIRGQLRRHRRRFGARALAQAAPTHAMAQAALGRAPILACRSARMTSALPLSGIRVANFGWVWAGPVVGQTLGFLGAEVYKIESRARIDLTRMLPPFGEGVRDPDRSLSNHACWAGNGSVVAQPEASRRAARSRATLIAHVRRRDRELRPRRHGGPAARLGRPPRREARPRHVLDAGRRPHRTAEGDPHLRPEPHQHDRPRQPDRLRRRRRRSPSRTRSPIPTTASWAPSRS